MDITRDDLHDLRDVLREDIKGVHDRLDDLNGRTRKAEEQIAVLKDRSSNTSDTTARWTAILAIVGGLLNEAAHRVLGTK